MNIVRNSFCLFFVVNLGLSPALAEEQQGIAESVEVESLGHGKSRFVYRASLPTCVSFDPKYRVVSATVAHPGDTLPVLDFGRIEIVISGGFPLFNCNAAGPNKEYAIPFEIASRVASSLENPFGLKRLTNYILTVNGSQLASVEVELHGEHFVETE